MPEALQLIDLSARARGSVLAAATGDALGWPIENRSGRVGGIQKVQPRLEFSDWTRREGGGYAPHEIMVPAGTYSDDTQLTLAVARSLLRGEAWLEHLIEFELPFWLIYERGGGGATRRAGQNWNRGKPPWSEELKKDARQRYFNAGGNGAVMRISPHVLVHSGSDFAPIAADILTDGLATHGHPRALVGALAHGYATWLALTQERALGFGELVERTLGEEATWGALPDPSSELMIPAIERPGFERTWEKTREEMRQLLRLASQSLKQGSLSVDRKTLEGLGAFDKQSGGSGNVAAASALFLASRYAARPAQGLTAAAFAKGADTDTIAALTGTLLGALHGSDWTNALRRQLQDAGYIDNLIALVAGGQFSPRPPGPPWRQAHRRRLYEVLAETRAGESLGGLPVFGRATVLWSAEIPTKSRNQITVWTVRTEDGLTLFIKRMVAAQAPTSSARQPASSTEATPSAQTSKAATPSAAKPYFWVGLEVQDLAASIQFYAELIGWPVREGPEDRVYVAERLVLEPGNAAVAESDPDMAQAGEKLIRFVSESELDSAWKRISARAPVTEIETKHGRRSFRCADPDGNVIEFRVGRPGNGDAL